MRLPSRPPCAQEDLEAASTGADDCRQQAAALTSALTARGRAAATAAAAADAALAKAAAERAALRSETNAAGARAHAAEAALAEEGAARQRLERVAAQLGAARHMPAGPAADGGGPKAGELPLLLRKVRSPAQGARIGCTPGLPCFCHGTPP
jgi:hypothetical protein